MSTNSVRPDKCCRPKQPRSVHLLVAFFSTSEKGRENGPVSKWIDSTWIVGCSDGLILVSGVALLELMSQAHRENLIIHNKSQRLIYVW
jgi:hypothetical protein